MKHCRHFLHCSGCLYEELEKTPDVFFRAKDYFLHEHALDLALEKGRPMGWRGRSKLAVRQGSDTHQIGLFEKNSHRVQAIPHCLVHHPAINEAVKRVLQWSFSAYDEVHHTGDLRYIQCSVEEKSSTVQLVLVLNCSPENEAVMNLWREKIHRAFDPSFWHSIWISCNPRKTNTIFGTYWEKVIGKDAIWHTLLGVDTAFGPAHFMQANLEMYERLLSDLSAHYTKEDRVLELYAGIGTIGIQAARHCHSVTLTEVQSQAEPYFELTRRMLPSEVSRKIRYLVLSAKESTRLVQDADTCIVDPPRSGLGKEVVDALLRGQNVKKLIYVSCGFNSLVADLTHIKKEHPNYKIKAAKAYLFFPGTDHVEIVAVLAL